MKSVTIKRLEVFQKAYKENKDAYIFDFYGPRGSGKTTEVCYETLEDIWNMRGDTLVLRKKKTKVKNSVKKEIEHLLFIHGFLPYFNVYNDRIETKPSADRRKCQWVFEGAHDILDLKSYSQFRNVWLEEANQFSAEDIEVLLPTLRRAGSRVFLTSNISHHQHWLNTKIRTNPSPLICSLKTTYKDNIYLNGGNVDGWINQQKIAYFGNELGYRLEILGEELDFATARIVPHYREITEEVSSKLDGRYFSGIAVSGNTAGIVVVKFKSSAPMPSVIALSSTKTETWDYNSFKEALEKTKGVVVLPREREDLRSVVSRMGKGSMCAKKKNVF